MHFTGKERDSETGNDNFKARYFGSSMGRFLSPDPSGISLANLGDPQQLNLYAYVRNNPLNLVDPTGLDCQETWNNEGTQITNTTNCVVTANDGTCSMSDTACQQQFQQSTSGPSTASTMQNLYSQGGQPQTQGSQSRLACAADFGQNHSIAAAFGKQNSFAGNLFGGNTFSNLAYLGQSVFGSRTPTGGDIAGTILGGAGQGLPGGGPGFKGAAGQASDAIVGGAVSAGYNAITGVGGQTLELGITASGTVASIATPLAATTVGTIVGYANLAKLALDAGTFAYGAIFACH